MPMRKTIVLLLFTLMMPLIGATQDRPPNFIIIFCDDLGYGDLSTFGNPTITTPNLDQMAIEGQKWTQFYVADPVCTPSRAGLLTGRYPIRSGMTSKVRGVLFPDSASGLQSEEVTIAEVLKQKDYATAAIGKWHLGHLPQYLPMAQGFDIYYGIPYSNDMNAKAKLWGKYSELTKDPEYQWEVSNYDVPLMQNEEIIERPADQRTITKRYSEKAVQYIKDNKDRPFFLYLAHSLPHIPLFASEDFLGSSKRGIYGDVLQEIDHGVGQILRTIKALNLEENTIILFTSDNGPWLAFNTHGGSAGPLRAGKGTTFEGGQRVPTIFWGPGNVKPRINHGLGSTLDVINTFAAFSGTTIPSDRKMDGYDLSNALKGDAESPREVFYYWATAKLHAVRSGSWKLHIAQKQEVRYGKQIQMDGPELYNVEKDISEKFDVIDANPKIASKLQELINKHLEDTADAGPDQLALRIKK